MSNHLFQRLRAEKVGIVALAGLGALEVVLAVPSSGVAGGFRVVLATFAMFVVPGWLLVRQADEDGDWLVLLFASLLASACGYVLFGFVAYEIGFRITGVEYVVPAVIIGVFILVLMGPSSQSGAHFASAGIAALLCLAAVVGALVTHLVLPAAPVEVAYSIATSSVDVTPTSVQATVTVDRVDTGRPQTLLLYVDGKLLATSMAPAGMGSVTLTARRPASADGACPQHIVIRTSSGVYLTPPFHCAGS
jgi:hypothetical protein